MLSKAINSAMQNIVNTFAEYGIKVQSQYNSDLDMISQYTKSWNVRSVFKETELELLSKDQVEALKKESYILMMYNYGPFRRNSEGRGNNINMEVVFNTNSPESEKEFGKLKKLGSNQFSDFFRMLREDKYKEWTPTVDGSNNILKSSYPADREETIFRVTGLGSDAGSPIGTISNDDYVLFDENGLLSEVTDLEVPPERKANHVRDMVLGEIDLTVKVLTSSTDLINDIQLLHVMKLQRNNPFYIDLDFGPDVGEHEFQYGTDFPEIESVGHVDYMQYGNLQHITFTFTLKGPFFSFYKSDSYPIDCVDVEFQVSGSKLEPTPRGEWVD